MLDPTAVVIVHYLDVVLMDKLIEVLMEEIAVVMEVIMDVALME